MENAYFFKKVSKRIRSAIGFMVCLFCVVLLGACGSAKLQEQVATAENYLNANNYAQAIPIFEEVLQKDGQNTSAYLGIAKAYLAENKFEETYSTLDTGFAANMSLEGTAYAQCQSAKDIYISMLKEKMDAATDIQQLQTLYNEALKKDATYKCTSEYLNKIANFALNDNSKVLEVLQFCADEMAKDPEVRLNNDTTVDLFIKARTVVNYDSIEEIGILADWFDVYKRNTDVLTKLLEKETGFVYPTPSLTDYSQTATEKLQQYGGHHLIRHFYLDNDGTLFAVNEEKGDFGVYDEEGKLLFDSATDIQDSNQDGFNNVTFYYDDQDRLVKYETSYWVFLEGRVPVSMVFEYDDKGNVTKITNGSDIRGIFEYDASGRLIKVKEPWNYNDPYNTVFQYDDEKKVINVTGYDIYDGSKHEYQKDYVALSEPIEFTMSTNASLRYIYASPVPYKPFELSDGTKGYYNENNSRVFVANMNHVVLADLAVYSQGYFEFNQLFGGTDDEIHMEQYTEPAEKCVNSHFAGKRYWAETEYGIFEISYDQYGLCEYIQYGDFAYTVFMKKYNADGSICECPVYFSLEEYDKYHKNYSYDIRSTGASNSYSGYCYREFYLN